MWRNLPRFEVFLFCFVALCRCGIRVGFSNWDSVRSAATAANNLFHTSTDFGTDLEAAPALT